MEFKDRLKISFLDCQDCNTVALRVSHQTLKGLQDDSIVPAF
jgi:hypothetical protein